MRYFCTYDQLDFATNSTNYLHIHWGPHGAHRFWAKDSLYIAGDVFDRICGMKLLCRSGALPQFDFYDDTVVTQSDWDRMREVLSSLGGEPAEFVAELSEWVGNGFDSFDCFTIVGV